MLKWLARGIGRDANLIVAGVIVLAAGAALGAWHVLTSVVEAVAR